MLQACLIASALGFAGPVSAGDEKVAAGLLAAFEANRASLAVAGTIYFHARDGSIGAKSSLEEFDAALKGDWPRLTSSEGLYLFDGKNRRYENGYPIAEMVAARAELIDSSQLLTDGETTLHDSISLQPYRKPLYHSPGLYAGAGPFFRNAYCIPINLGNPEPPYFDLGKHLGDALHGRGGAVLAEVDPQARLDGASVVKLRVDLPNDPKDSGRPRFTFWVDPDHGAIPVRMRCVRISPQDQVITIYQINNDDIRRVDRGWLPFRYSVAETSLTPTGGTSADLVHEVVIEEADFANPPPRSAFALAFPWPVRLSHPDQNGDLGTRQVWDLKDFSPEARERARLLWSLDVESARTSAAAAGPHWMAWLGAFALIGVAVLGASGLSAFRKARRARSDRAATGDDPSDGV